MKIDFMKNTSIDSTKENMRSGLLIDSSSNSLFIQSSMIGCSGCSFNSYDIVPFKVNDSIYEIIFSNCLVVPHVDEDFRQNIEFLKYKIRSNTISKDTNKYSAFKIRLK